MKILFFYALLLSGIIQAMEEDESGRRVVKEGAEAKREDWERLEGLINQLNNNDYYEFSNDTYVFSETRNRPEIEKMKLTCENLEAVFNKIHGKKFQPSKTLKEICLNFINKNKKVFSKKQLLALPINMQLLLGMGMKQENAICFEELDDDIFYAVHNNEIFPAFTFSGKQLKPRSKLVKTIECDWNRSKVILNKLKVKKLQSPETLKDICINFISKNKKLFSKNKLLKLPIKIQLLLGIELECVICFLELNKDREELSCGHDDFHKACIKKWQEKKKPAICPFCLKETNIVN